jgi:hypothetical protein
VPFVGHVTEKVLRSPIWPLTGVRSITLQTALYEGLAVDTAEEVGLITTVALEPRSGNKVASTVEAA